MEWNNWFVWNIRLGLDYKNCVKMRCLIGCGKIVRLYFIDLLEFYFLNMNVSFFIMNFMVNLFECLFVMKVYVC